jgi:hypothetical protein
MARSRRLNEEQPRFQSILQILRLMLDYATILTVPDNALVEHFTGIHMSEKEMNRYIDSSRINFIGNTNWDMLTGSLQSGANRSIRSMVLRDTT